MTPDALPVTRRGVTRWESPPAVSTGPVTYVHPTAIAVPESDLRDMLDRLDQHDATDPILAAINVLDVKLAVVIAATDRLVRVLEAVADAVDVRIEVEA